MLLRAMRKRRSFIPETLSDADLPRIAVVVPTYNEEAIIGAMLQNVLKVDYPVERMEILVVDSASKDRTREVIEGFLGDKRVRLISESRRGWNLAVRLACQEAKGDVIVLSGADVFYRPDALRRMCVHFASHEVGAVTGRQVLLNQNESFATEMEGKYRKWQYFVTEAESLIDQPFDVKGEMIAARKPIITSVLERIGDTATVDTCIPLETRAQGYRLSYEPEAMYTESAALAAGERLHSQIRRGRNLIECTFHYLWMLWRPQYGIFGMLIFPYHFAWLALFPWVFFASIVCSLVATFYYPVCALLFLLAAVALTRKEWRVFVSSFLMGQTALAIGLLLCARKAPAIERIDSTRKSSLEKFPSKAVPSVLSV
jgi:cellulose synthase/poly-beta-1,6-N-acetylglucosamine synthase-like glycosyltransferase